MSTRVIGNSLIRVAIVMAVAMFVTGLAPDIQVVDQEVLWRSPLVAPVVLGAIGYLLLYSSLIPPDSNKQK